MRLTFNTDLRQWRTFLRMWLAIPFLVWLLAPVISQPLAAELKIPACLLSYQFGPEQYILIAEKSTQTLYVYSNYQPEPIETFKITSGKNNGPKVVEGDMKTPEGIYFFRRTLEGGELPKTDDYGEKAFTMNYPNAIDRQENKNGSGIWLHGAFDTEKIKTPYNSRGCVVLNNDDLVKISKYIYLNRTPICIYDKVRFDTLENIQKKRERFIGYLSRWKSHWENKNIDGYISYYDDGFTDNGMGLAQFKAFKNRLNQRYKFIRIRLSDINLYTFNGYYVVFFNQLYISDLNHFYSRKIQYWKDLGNTGKIVDEANVRIAPITKIEVTKGNYITIDEFRKDCMKQLRAETMTITPPAFFLKNISIVGKSIKLTLGHSGTDGGLKVIPVLRMESKNDGSASYRSLEGIPLQEGVPPRSYDRAVDVRGRETTVVIAKEKDLKLISLTLFFINRDNDFQQIITHFVNSRRP